MEHGQDQSQFVKVNAYDPIEVMKVGLLNIVKQLWNVKNLFILLIIQMIFLIN